jgi:hypothetical protein
VHRATQVAASSLVIVTVIYCFLGSLLKTFDETYQATAITSSNVNHYVSETRIDSPDTIGKLSFRRGPPAKAPASTDFHYLKFWSDFSLQFRSSLFGALKMEDTGNTALA